MNKSKAVIIVKNADALRVAASSARISTQQGTAMEIFEGSMGDARDLKLLDKVLASGHKSVIEHQNFGIAFNNVSVMVEQFVIEARLASFTVKSRRYVDFSGAGYVMPEDLTPELCEIYDETMQARFNDYQRLMEMGIPKEDARFVLPYSLRSNFYMTVNARELITLICAMLKGRGKGFPEIESLGSQLKTQMDELYPGVVDAEFARFCSYSSSPLPRHLEMPHNTMGAVELISGQTNAETLIGKATAFFERIEKGDWRSLLTDARPRELEILYYVFHIKNISLACLTHFARHRILSPIIPPVSRALAGGRYIMPDSVSANMEAESVFRRAFSQQTEAAERALQIGLTSTDLSYFCMSGHQLDIMLGINARELMHFMKLRTCSRAQWEIRGIAGQMLELLREQFPELYDLYGPSCRFGPCPEGRMSCGRPQNRI